MPTTGATAAPTDEHAKACTRRYFVSDLHLFSRRSNAGRYMDAIRERAGEAEALVLGGDIFDFRWSSLPSAGATLDAALSWLGELADHAPSCRLHYVLGNHDYHRELIAALPELAAAHGNFDWHPLFLRLDDSVFLHGDVSDHRAMSVESLAASRERWLDATPRGALWNRAYDLAVLARLHVLVPHVARPVGVVVRRLSAYLGVIGEDAEAGVRHVYFGHTHAPIAAHSHAGLVFHNGGAAIRGLPFEIVEVAPPTRSRRARPRP